MSQFQDEYNFQVEEEIQPQKPPQLHPPYSFNKSLRSQQQSNKSQKKEVMAKQEQQLAYFTSPGILKKTPPKSLASRQVSFVDQGHEQSILNMKQSKTESKGPQTPQKKTAKENPSSHSSNPSQHHQNEHGYEPEQLEKIVYIQRTIRAVQLCKRTNNLKQIKVYLASAKNAMPIKVEPKISNPTVIQARQKYAQQYFSEDQIQEMKSKSKGTIFNCRLSNGDIYFGRWFSQQKTGYAKYFMQNGGYYEGEFINDKMEGRGIMILPDGTTYLGTFIDGKLNTYGEIHMPDEISYRGQVLNNQPHGEGVMKDKLKNITYEGGFLNGVKHGKGKLFAPEFDYIGDMANNSFHGRGEIYYRDESKYIGSFQNGMKHGKGEFTFRDRRQYKGHYRNDLKEGHGEFTFPDGRSYNGSWMNGVKHGEGVIKDKNGNEEKCYWFEGEKSYKRHP